jgi:transcription initiation factor TFIID subunit 2
MTPSMMGRIIFIFAIEWAIINKTLEAADKAHPPQVSQPVKPQSRTLPPVPKSFPSSPQVSVPASVSEKGKTSSVPNSVPVASTSRPIIKLKVGSQSKPLETPLEPVPKVRVKKPKPLESSTSVTPVIDAPPPPYVDDGSHDILQEVLAIEREKDEQRHRLVVEKGKDKPTVNGASGKRKKPDIVDEDDILAFTKPTKKERPSPSGPSSTSSKTEPQGPEPPSTKAASGMQRPKKERVETSRPPTAESPRISLKGKEKEVAPPTQALPPSTPTPVQTKTKKPPVVHATPLNDKKCKDLLKALAKAPEAAIFMHPVDPIRDGCPTCVFR